MYSSRNKQFYLDLMHTHLDGANTALFVLSEKMMLHAGNHLAREWLVDIGENNSDNLDPVPITCLFNHPESETSFIARFEEAKNGKPVQFRCPIHAPGTGQRWIEFNLSRADADGETIIVGVAHDVTEQHHEHEHARKLARVIEQTVDAVSFTDLNGTIEYVNPAYEKLTGHARQEVQGQNAGILKSGLQSLEFYRNLWTTILSGKVFHGIFVNRRKNGSLYHEEKTITPLKDDHGQITHFIATGRDITERIEYQERLHRMAHFDMLTGLPNRALFTDRLSQALARARWNKRVVGVLFLDLDRFKLINDSLGHSIGDHLLQAVATRLLQCVREGDTVARIGGDELAIILEDIAQTEDVTAVTSKIVDAFAIAFDVDGRELFVNASIGVSLHPADGEDAQTLLKNADIAMSRAKEQGGNNFHYFSAQMDTQSTDRLVLENGMRCALARQEFLLHYQPQVDLRTGEVIGVEALVRWRHPELGLVSPLSFIPLAEEIGLIVPLSEWILREACAQNKTLQANGFPPLRMAVNLSGRHFRQSDLADTVALILEETGLDPRYLTIEITESTLVQQTDATLSTLRQLRNMGAHISIDDFGIGYSSLSYLKRLPIDVLKIDRSFVRDITTDPDDAAIATTIITLAHSLGLKVVAEGVETKEQLAFLREHDCDAMQGYYFSKPVPADLLGRLLQVFGIPVRAPA
jgi:diguanylate cyclase (GGDEF)-like protein/PAS domain S-box-containing protein